MVRNILLIIFLLILLTNCDLFEPKSDSNIDISGIVINESTGNLISSIGITLEIGTAGWGGYQIVDSTRSDQNGEFHIYYDANDNQSLLHIYFNDEPYNSNYSIFNFSVKPGDKLNKEIYLYQNTSLVVKMVSDNPVQKGEYTLWIPGMGTSSGTTLTTHRAKGNFFNEVRLNYTRNTKNYEIVDSVYCPIDTTTFFTLKY